MSLTNPSGCFEQPSCILIIHSVVNAIVLISLSLGFQEYCLHYSDSIVNQPPPLLTAFQPHVDCVTHLETCEHSRRLLIISASADCSVAVGNISGSPVGIFGQVNTKCYLTDNLQKSSGTDI